MALYPRQASLFSSKENKAAAGSSAQPGAKPTTARSALTSASTTSNTTKPAANSQAGSKVSTGSKAQAGENAPAATAKYTTSLVMASLAARKARLPLSSVDATKPQVFRDRTPHVLRAIRAQVAPPAAVADASAVDAPPTKAHDAMRPIRALCAPAESSFNFVAPVADAPLAKAADPSRPIRALGVSASSASNVASAVIAALAAKPVVTRTVVTAELAKPAPLAGQKRRANIAEPERMVRPKISKDVAAPSGLKRRASVVEPERAVQPKLTKESSASTSRSDDAEDKVSATLPDSDSADSQATAVELDLPADVKHRRIAKPSRAYSTLRTLAGQVAEAAPAASAAVAKPTEAKAEDEAKRDWDDIDAEDSDDPLMVSEYITDIIDYLREREVVTMPSSTYMGKQKELTWEMRRVLVSWMIQTHYQLRMLPETIFLAVNIIDRFLSKRQVAVAKFQLIGVTALMLACKYEETTTPHIEDFVFLSGNSYTAKEIFNTEVFLLTVLGFDLSFPNPMTFLRRVSKAEDYNMQTRTVAKYLMEVCLLDQRMIHCTPSHIAAAGIYLGRRMLESGPWTANLRHYSGYTEEELKPSAAIMLDYLMNQTADDFVFRKYEHRRYLVVSKFCLDWVAFHQNEIMPMTPPAGYFTSAADADADAEHPRTSAVAATAANSLAAITTA